MATRRKRYVASFLGAGALAIGAALLLVLRAEWRSGSPSPAGSDDAGPAKPCVPELQHPSVTGPVREQQVMTFIYQTRNQAGDRDPDREIARLKVALDSYPEHADTDYVAMFSWLKKKLDAVPEGSDEAKRMRLEYWESQLKTGEWRDTEYELKGDFWLPGEFERMQEERSRW